MSELDDVAATIEAAMAATPPGREDVVDLYLSWPTAPSSVEATATELAAILGPHAFARTSRRVAVATWAGPGHPVRQYTFRPNPDGAGVVEDSLVRGLHPMVGRRLDLWRLRNFTITRLEAAAGVLLYRCVAPGNESDVRLVALAQIRELSVVRDGSGRVTSLPQAERAIASCVDAIRRARTAAGPRARLDMNHVWLHIWPVIDAPVEQLTALQRAIAPLTVGAGVEEIVATGRITGPKGSPVLVSARFSYQPGSGVEANVSGPPTKRLEPLDDYAQKVLRSRRRGTVYPYEVVPLLIEGGGEWVEYDLSADSGVDGLPLRLEPVDRPAGGNSCGIVVGLARTPTPRYPEGISRVVLAGDPTRSLGAIAEAECARVMAALDLAEEQGLPVEWFALSAGARISMDSGTENMDWVARVLRRIIEFTQNGGEINVVVTGINVGAQPYWNAEATMLMHTKGILVMTPESAMVLTGKTSLDYSGGVSAEDNFGLGGYDRVMGPNGQAQYWAPDLASAVDVLFAHYEHSYVAPGETGPRPAVTTDPRDRDVCSYPHQAPDSDFTTVGDIFSAATNPERKKPFDIRTLMRSVADADHPTLERWAGMADAETSVVFDAHLGGYPVALLGIESRPVVRRGFPPTDGPDTWTAGTLFPRSSKKTARAINAASGSRPLVVLANLSGFDGSPESMRMLQLEYGAEIGRAVVNFDGPIVFCVVSRYHGGAFVVFSKTLNDRMQVLAVDGSFASVIGGAPAAGVVFTGEVDTRTSADPRVRELERRLAAADEVERARLRGELADLRAAVRSEKLTEVAAEFDAVHSIERAVAMGSVDAIIAPHELRPRLIEALERGLAG
jgi:acetyl-CoA carboxylase carboxyltransferase component